MLMGVCERDLSASTLAVVAKHAHDVIQRDQAEGQTEYPGYADQIIHAVALMPLQNKPGCSSKTA